MNIKFLTKAQTLLLILLIAGFFVRLYKFDNPVADWHSWRQADTSAVSRNFVTGGFDVLHPKFDDLSNVASGTDNPNGYRFVEFPIYNVLQAAGYKYMGFITLEEWGRLITIFASLISTAFLFLLIRKRFGKKAALLTSFFFLFLPFNIYYSRVILPDPSMVMAILGATYFFQLWLEESPKCKVKSPKLFNRTNVLYIISLLFMTLSLLLKPYALFFTLSMIYLAFEKYGLKFFRKWQLWIFMILSVIPLALWRIWMLNFPAGIPASAWLFNGNHIRFRPSFFYWLGYKRLTQLIIGYFGWIFIIPLFIFKIYKRKDIYFALSFALSSIIYVSVLATGNVQHDYYQILTIPSLSIILGLGSLILINKLNSIYRYLGFILFFVIFALSFYFSWAIVQGYFYIDNPSIVAAGNYIDKNTPKNAKVIALYQGDTSFLYQTKRKGWASLSKSVPELINLGADYLVIANPTKVDLGIGKTYKIVTENKQFVLFNLKEKP